MLLVCSRGWRQRCCSSILLSPSSRRSFPCFWDMRFGDSPCQSFHNTACGACCTRPEPISRCSWDWCFCLSWDQGHGRWTRSYRSKRFNQYVQLRVAIPGHSYCRILRLSKSVVFRDSEETVGTTGKRHEFWCRLSGAGPVIIVMSFDVLHQCGQFLYFHRLLVESDIHDSQYVALPGTDEFFER